MLLASVLMLAGCGSRARTADQIVFGITWEPISFYPVRTLDSASYYAQTLVYEGLVKYDHQMNIVPALAESYNISPDATTYQFNLRPNIKFSDGQPVTMEDVVESIKLVADKASPYHGDYEDISSINAVDDRTLVLKLSAPCAPLLSRIIEIRILPARIIRLPDHGKNLLSRAPLGAGPFCLVSWESGSELVFEPNKTYWDKPPAFKRLVWRVVPDRSLLALALKNGELDVAQVDARTCDYLMASGRRNLSMEQFPASRTIYFGFNLRKQPFDSQAVRQGICYATNRAALVSQLYRGYGRIAHTDFPPTGWTYNPHSSLFPYDPKQARRCLANAGFKWNGTQWQKDGKQLAFSILTVTDYQDVAQVIADNLHQIGIPTEVQVAEFSTLRMRYLKTGKFQSVVWSRSVGPDPECFLNWSSKGPLNFSKFSNSRLDELLQLGRRARSKAQRLPLYQEVQEILSTELPWVFLLHPNLLVAHSPNIKNIMQPGQQVTGLPWDNPLFNAASWQKLL